MHRIGEDFYFHLAPLRDIEGSSGDLMPDSRESPSAVRVPHTGLLYGRKVRPVFRNTPFSKARNDLRQVSCFAGKVLVARFEYPKSKISQPLHRGARFTLYVLSSLSNGRTHQYI